MEVKRVTARSQTSLSESLSRAGARCLMFEGSEFLFLERAEEAELTLSKETASELSTLNSVTSADSVVMLDDNQRVEVLVGLTQLADLSIKDFSKIRTIGLVPQLTHRLGNWRRERQLRDGLWSVTFETHENSDEALRQTLESRILEPWSSRRKVHSSFVVRSKAQTLLRDSNADFFYFAGHAVPREAMWECKFVTVDHIRPARQIIFIDGLDNALADARLLSGVLKKEIERLADEGAARNTSSEPVPGTSTNQEQKGQGSEAAVDANAVVESVESATEALDAVLMTLTTPPNDGLDWSKAPDTDTAPAQRGYDPVRKAIEIREKLQRSVSFVDSATWARARGVQSNPSAALGKYKRKGRIFSVRSGRRDLYPAFQFADNNAEILPVVEKILKAVPKEAQGWPLLSWFEAKNVLLNDRKPSEVLASEPDAVLRAAERFYSRDD